MLPVHTGRQKYSCGPVTAIPNLLPVSLPESTKKLIYASLTESSWKKHASALSNFKKFEKVSKDPHPWPLNKQSIQSYTAWALTECKLKPSTVSSYIATIAFMHKLKNMDSNNCKDIVTKAMIRGAENLNFYSDVTKETRKVMTLPLLKLLGNSIAKSSWEDDSKQVVWATLTTAFFGSFRMGELLSKREGSFNRAEALLWSDVIFKKDSVIIRVKIPKSRDPKGEFVELFVIKGSCYCPVKALLRLKMLKGVGIRETFPVFMFKSGKLLTPATLNSTLHQLLVPHIGEAAMQITGHSFRAALPSALANRPDLANDEDVKLWGRWDSTAFRRYTRLKPEQKRAVFAKIVASLDRL